MGRMWGVLWGGLTICACVLADSNTTPPRVNGMLWAGTTFQLRATASVEDQLIATSESAQVRVGQVIRWESTLQSPTGRSWVSGSNPPEFHVLVTNRGNGWDNLALTLQQYETVESFTWNTELLEMHPNGRQVRVQGGMGSLIEPGQGLTYVVRASLRSTPTDGAWARLSLTARGASAPQVQEDFVVGAVLRDWIRLRAWCYGDHAQLVAPILYQGRLVWMGTNVNNRETRIFWSSDPVENTRPDAPLGNQRMVYGRALRDFVPTGFSVGLGDGWFTGRGNQLIRIDLQRVVNNNTSSDPFSVVQFPPGVSPHLDLEPLVFNGRLYVAGSDRRLHAILPEGLRVGQSMPMPASYGAFSTNLVHIGRIFYIGTENGWVVQFDAATGSLRTARRVSNQRLHSLAVAPLGRVLLARVGNREVVALNPNQLNLLWRRTLNEDLVSPVASSPEREACVVVSRSGTLYAFHTRTGTLLPHYPQRIFGNDATLTRASVALVRRTDRTLAHLYVLAQQDTGTEVTQPLFRIVTFENPYNRLEYDSNTLHAGANYLPVLLFTGNRNTSYCLIASQGATGVAGTVAGIPLR